MLSLSRYSLIKFLIVNVISSQEEVSYFVIEIKFLSIKTLLTKGKLKSLNARGEFSHSSIELNSIWKSTSFLFATNFSAARSK